MNTTTSIVRATNEDWQMLAGIGKTSFIESHGHSASAKDINQYVEANYNAAALKKEINDPQNIYHIIRHNKQPAGFSKIIFNAAHPAIRLDNVTKLERLYLLKEYYDLKLGYELFNFNLQLSKDNHQAGMWLFVWKDNQRAARFYEKAGFTTIGSYDFKLTDTHSNPNHLMLLPY